MRIYGTSPLYNYVELIFRCKRMFILAILLGALVASWMLRQQVDSYQADMLIALVGRPQVTQSVGRTASPEDIRRKANLLLGWLKEFDDFPEMVTKNANLDTRYTPAIYKNKVKEFQARTTMTLAGSGNYLRVGLVWGNPDEAERLLHELFLAWQNKWVDTQTAGRTFLRQTLQKQYERAEAEANRLQMEKMRYTMRHWKTQSSFLASAVSRVDQLQAAITQTQGDIEDARERLVQIGIQLQATPREITVDTKVTTTREDPALKLKADLVEAEKKLNQSLQVYSEAHPTVVKLRREIESLKQQIAETSKQENAGPTATSTDVHRTMNPEYQKLVSLQNEFTQAIRAWGRRQEQFQKALQETQGVLMQMPGEEIRYSRLTRDYTMKDSVRRSREGMLEQAKLDEEQEKDWERNSMSIAVEPKPEKMQTNSKRTMLYVLGPMMGIFIAFCFSLLAEALDHTLRTPVEVEKYLGKPVLAVIPKMKAARQSRKLLGGSSNPSITS